MHISTLARSPDGFCFLYVFVYENRRTCMKFTNMTWTPRRPDPAGDVRRAASQRHFGSYIVFATKLIHTNLRRTITEMSNTSSWGRNRKKQMSEKPAGKTNIPPRGRAAVTTPIRFGGKPFRPGSTVPNRPEAPPSAAGATTGVPAYHLVSKRRGTSDLPPRDNGRVRN